jgi:hypothetical protein
VDELLCTDFWAVTSFYFKPRSGESSIWMKNIFLSLQRKYIGAFARALKGIPVARPEDMERAGPGFVTCVGTDVVGHGGTRFTLSRELFPARNDGVESLLEMMDLL